MTQTSSQCSFVSHFMRRPYLPIPFVVWVGFVSPAWKVLRTTLPWELGTYPQRPWEVSLSEKGPNPFPSKSGSSLGSVLCARLFRKKKLMAKPQRAIVKKKKKKKF